MAVYFQTSTLNISRSLTPRQHNRGQSDRSAIGYREPADGRTESVPAVCVGCEESEYDGVSGRVLFREDFIRDGLRVPSTTTLL